MYRRHPAGSFDFVFRVLLLVAPPGRYSSAQSPSSTAEPICEAAGFERVAECQSATLVIAPKFRLPIRRGDHPGLLGDDFESNPASEELWRHREEE